MNLPRPENEKHSNSAPTIRSTMVHSHHLLCFDIVGPFAALNLKISTKMLCEVSDDVVSRFEVGDSKVSEVARVVKRLLTRKSRLVG